MVIFLYGEGGTLKIVEEINEYIMLMLNECMKRLIYYYFSILRRINPCSVSKYQLQSAPLVPDIEVHHVGGGPDDPEGEGVEDDEEQEGDERHHHEVS